MPPSSLTLSWVVVQCHTYITNFSSASQEGDEKNILTKLGRKHRYSAEKNRKEKQYLIALHVVVCQAIIVCSGLHCGFKPSWVVLHYISGLGVFLFKAFKAFCTWKSFELTTTTSHTCFIGPDIAAGLGFADFSPSGRTLKISTHFARLPIASSFPNKMSVYSRGPAPLRFCWIRQTGKMHVYLGMLSIQWHLISTAMSYTVCLKGYRIPVVSYAGALTQLCCSVQLKIYVWAPTLGVNGGIEGMFSGLRVWRAPCLRK